MLVIDQAGNKLLRTLYRVLGILGSACGDVE